MGEFRLKLDFDLACPGGGPGEGVSSLICPNWLCLCHLGPFCACELILVVSARQDERAFMSSLSFHRSLVSVVQRTYVQSGTPVEIEWTP